MANNYFGDLANTLNKTSQSITPVTPVNDTVNNAINTANNAMSALGVPSQSYWDDVLNNFGGMLSQTGLYSNNSNNTPFDTYKDLRLNNNNSNNNGFEFGFNTPTLTAVGMGIQGLSGLANAFLGYKSYQQAKNQWKFQKKLANRNLANQAKTINNTYDNAAQVAAGMIGGQDASGNYGFTDQAIVDKYANRAKNQHVDGSPIK